MNESEGIEWWKSANPERGEVLEGSHVEPCPLCGDGWIGEVRYQARYGIALDRIGKGALYYGLVCDGCAWLFRDQVNRSLRPGKSALEKRHDRDYRKFCRGKLYPEIVVKHCSADGCELEGRIEKGFYDWGRTTAKQQRV